MRRVILFFLMIIWILEIVIVESYNFNAILKWILQGVFAIRAISAGIQLSKEGNTRK